MTLTPQIRLYSIVPYDRSAKVAWLLTELGVAFENRRLSREKKELDSPEFLKINPMGRVPALEIDGMVLFESGAICAYLSDLFLDRRMAPALDSSERAQYQQWMYFASCTLDVFQPRVMIVEDIPAGELYSKKLESLQSDLKDGLHTLEQTLRNQSYLIGGRFTTADICVSYHLNWLRLWPELDTVFQDFPSVLAYIERMKKSPSAIQAEVFTYSE